MDSRRLRDCHPGGGNRVFHRRHQAGKTGQLSAPLDQNRKLPGAITSARQARTPWKTLDPVATPVSFLEGYAILKTGDARSAIPLFEQARRENPNRLYILQNLADAYLAAGRKADAIERLELATRRYPQDAPTRAALERARTVQ